SKRSASNERKYLNRAASARFIVPLPCNDGIQVSVHDRFSIKHLAQREIPSGESFRHTLGQRAEHPSADRIATTPASWHGRRRPFRANERPHLCSPYPRKPARFHRE